MAQSDKIVQMHQDQISLAKLEFEKFKAYISKAFIYNLKFSFLTYDENKDIWRAKFEYTPENEQFLIQQTKRFLHLLPVDSRNYKSPAFFKTLIGLISDYLSIYICKKGISNRNICKNEIRDILYKDNPHVNLEINRYTTENEQAWGKMQKKKRKNRERKLAQKEKKRIAKEKALQEPKTVVKIKITYHKEELAKLRQKQLNILIAQMRKDLSL